VQVYLTCNTLPRNDELERLPEFLQYSQQIGIDALIVADLGVLQLAQRHAPKVELHMSTQTGIVNYATANALYQMGAKRIVVARELSLEDIAEIRSRVPADLDIEAFVHGAMCVSFSGRCLLSAYMNNRDANRGDCSQPCRWEYSLVEKKRPNQYLDIEEDGKGTYILNSRDMCMVDHIPELAKAGITSLKIEGRAKSAYYVAVTTHAYRAAIDHYYTSPTEPLPSWISEEVHKISHREYSTGFYFGSEPGQVTDNGGYVREYDVVAVCEDYHDGIATLTQRNKFFSGDTLDVLEAGKAPYLVTLDRLYNSDGEPITETPHAMMKITAPCETPIGKGAVLRKARAANP
jgi:putative protease